MYNKKLSIFITLIFIIAISLQYSVNANSTEQTLISRINKIAQQVSRLTSENVEEDSNEVVTIKVNDDVFYEAIVGTYGGNPTENALEFTMTREQINALTEFEYTGSDLKKIKDITGIENFKNIETLKLNKNAITDISKITELTNLTYLEIKSNGLKTLPDLSKLTKLSVLDISDNSISSLEGITKNYALTKLYAASNFVTNIIPITAIIALQEVDLSSNNISDIASIYRLTNLQVLNLSDNTSIREIESITNLANLNKLILNGDNAITDLTKLVEKGADKKTPKLINLKHLELQGVNNSSSKITISNLKVLTNLEFLNVNNNNLGSTGLNGIIELQNLKTLYANYNGIVDISYFVQLDSYGNVKAVSKISELRMEHNEIEKVDTLGYMADTITYLDLRNNHIHHINSIEQLSNLQSKYLFLQEQTANFMIKKKTNTNVEQKIILETIVQYCKKPNSKIYSENANFDVTDAATLNTDKYIIPNVGTGKYDEEPGHYNIVFPENIEVGSVGTVTIRGGRAAGSVFTYEITNNTGSKVYDSIVFEDYYLTDRVATELLRKEKNLVGWIPYILNIEYKEIATVDELILTGDEGRRVKSIKGLESFINLKYIDLAVNSISSDNSVSKINLLKDLPKIETLILSDNDLKTADVITNYKNITKIDLSNNEISDLESFKTWLEMLASNRNAKSKLVELNVSGNNITDLSPIQEITTLTNLNVGYNNIKDIKPIVALTELAILNISSNKIEDISILKDLTKLRTLYLASNKVKDISSIANLNLYDLDISNNRIEDLEYIKNMSSLTNIIANTNKISTIEPIKDFIINNLGLNYQKLHYALQETDEKIVTVELPKLFTEAKQENGLIYTEKDFACTNCTLTADGKVQINVEELGHNIATVIIKGGNATGSQLAIAESLKPVLKYSTEEKTNQDVTVTISFDGRQANIINNDGKNTYTFTENGEFTFDYEDEYGFSGTITAKVTWIDKEGPKATVTLSKTEITKEDVIVTITANEECKAVEGWTLSEDKKILTKTYSNNTNEKITLEDEIGNKSEIDVIITNIDKTAPEITGVVDGQTYNHVVTPVITDENLKLVELKKDGKIVENYTSETPITENGEYILTAKDRADNTTTLNFIINIKYDEKILSSIAITSEPSKKDYVAGENFDPAGMVVTATYNDGSKKVVTNYTVTDGDNLEVGKTNVTISYTENGVTKPATQEITVVPKEEENASLKGDANGDNKVDFMDILVINKHRLGKIKLTGVYLEKADVTRDGKVDFMDILQINKYRLGKINSL